MIGIAMYTTIITLWKQNKNKSEISLITGHTRKTIRRIIKKYETEKKELPDEKQVCSTLIKYQKEILDFMEKGLSKLRIYEEISRLGSTVSYSSVTRFIRSIETKHDICIRFHTEAGEESQVDFGYVGRQPDYNGCIRKAWAFNMRLSYSRLDYYEIVFDQKVETFIRCHINAFRYFGGVVGLVKIDNLKAAILEANFYEPIYQQLYKSFADHYGFDPMPCRVRQPQEKGKVESGIKYIKNNFFAGRKFSSFNQLCFELRNWQDNKCNKRLHGTTKRIPRELFDLEERSILKQLPISEFNMGIVGMRKVQRDCHIVVNGNYYSVPYEYVGQEVEVAVNDKLLKIYQGRKQVATHLYNSDRGKFVTNRSHYPEYKLCMPSSLEYQEKYRQKLSTLGPNASKMFELLLIKRSIDWPRIAKGILSLQKLYNVEVIDLACARALAFDITLYSKIKSICASGTYNLPLEREARNDNTIAA